MRKDLLQSLITARSIPPELLSLPVHLSAIQPDTPHLTVPSLARLPTPIIPIMTSRPRPLSAYLRVKGMNARPITWPTVPKGKERIRVCLHAGNNREEVEALALAMVEWAENEKNTVGSFQVVRQDNLVGQPVQAKL